MSEAKTIKFLKREALAAFLASDPTTVPIPTARAVLGAGKGNKPTLNHAFVAACCGVAAPSETFVIGEGWDGDRHGGLIAAPGWKVEGRDLVEFATFSEVSDGLCGGGREFFGGYKMAYLVGLLFVLRHGNGVEQGRAVRAISAYLALDFLLTVPGTGEVIEIGGRATGGPNTYSAILQRLWRGDKGVRVPRSDAAISCQMFEALTPEERAMLPAFPGGVEDAVEILRKAKVVCPANFEWWGWKSRAWRGQVAPEDGRSWFIDKRTGDNAMVVTAAESTFRNFPDEVLSQRPTEESTHDWHLALTEEGFQVHRRPGGEGKLPASEKPIPPPRPEEPEPPGQEPDLLDAVRAWAVSPEAPKGRDRFREQLLDRMKGIRGVAR